MAVRNTMLNWNELFSKKVLGQIVCYCLFFSLIGYFSNTPNYHRYDNQQAIVKLSLRHAGKTLGECLIRSTEELALLPPNMRIAKVCPRERSPLQLAMIINGETVYDQRLLPRGVHQDGLSSVYFSILVKAGEIELEVKMKDHFEQTSFPYQLSQKLTMKPSQVLVVDFDSKSGKFITI